MVGMPSARSPSPFGFGIITRRTGSGRYVFETNSSRQPQPCFQAPLLDLREGHLVHTRGARIGASHPIGVLQDVLATNLVVEHVEAESRLRLRLAIELSLKAPDLIWCYRAHRQSPSPPSSKAHQKSGSFAP